MNTAWKPPALRRPDPLHHFADTIAERGGQDCSTARSKQFECDFGVMAIAPHYRRQTISAVLLVPHYAAEVIPAYCRAHGVSRSMSLPEVLCHVGQIGATEMTVSEFCRLRQTACRTHAPAFGPHDRQGLRAVKRSKEVLKKRAQATFKKHERFPQTAPPRL